MPHPFVLVPGGQVSLPLYIFTFMITVSKLQARRTFITVVNLSSRSFRTSASSGHENRVVGTLPDTFESLGVDEFVVRGVKRAFPHINGPTIMQKEFIPAIMSGKDILLQDQTGTGKSLGLLLALLSKPRATRQEAPRYWKDRASRRVEVKEAITSILIVPHNDLALQFAHWVKSMRLTREPNSLVQTLLKDASENYEDQLSRIGKESPHILITTPKALDACWEKGKHLFTLDSVSTIVLEEADLLLRVPSNNTPKEVQKRWRKHPPVVRELLADVFRNRPKNGPVPKPLAVGKNAPLSKPVQLVLASATLRPAVRKFLFLETKWLSQEPGETLTLEGTRSMDPRRDPVRHYGLFVDVSGSIRNLKDEEDHVEDEPVLVDTAPNHETDDEVSDEESMEMDESDIMQSLDTNITPMGETLLWNGNRLASQLMDAIASIFAFEVPQYALLIIPSTVSAKRTVEDLRSLGIKAINLDDYVSKPAEALHHLGAHSSKVKSTSSRVQPNNEVQKHTAEADDGSHFDDPIMLVAIQTAVRGIDLPLISHVFIAGVPESDVEYLHLAGRVGRMGSGPAPKGGVKKVITFLPEPNLNPRTGNRKALELEKRPKKRLEALWNMIGIKPSYYGKAL